MPKASSRRTVPETDSPWRQSIVGHADVDPRTLTPHPQNWRTHPATQTAALQGSLNDLGWIRSLTVNQVTGHILDGEDRLTLALAEGAVTVPVEYVALSPEQEAQALLMLDPIAALAGTDTARLAALLQDVQSGEPAIQQMLSELAQREGIVPADGHGTGMGGEDDAEPQIDRAEELREQWGVEVGQLWACGEHRVLCGDCTDKAVVERLLDGAVPLLMVTDPPYSVEYDANWRNDAADKGFLQHAERRVGRVVADDRVDWREAWRLFPGAVVYCWYDARRASTVQESLESCDFEMRCQIIWGKQMFAISRGHYHWQHEPCWYAVRKGATASWVGDHSQTTLWSIILDKNVEGGHSTQKPLECMARPIRNHEASEVYDPFLGSGTTLIACEHLHRRCFACEIDPGYVAVTLERYRDVTGEQPTLIP